MCFADDYKQMKAMTSRTCFFIKIINYEAYVVNSFIITDLCVLHFIYLYQEIYGDMV